MADIQYLNYGDLQINLLDLFNNLADNVIKYVQKQPWSNKRKEKFMSAYQDIMTKGIRGASNNTGQWMIDVNGLYDFDSMNNRDKEAYEEAAYFILLLMSRLPTKASQENKSEEKKEEVLKTKFDNNYFISSFGKHLSDTEFGGSPISMDSDWNILDERDEKTGLRGRSVRSQYLSRALQSYANSLDESKLDFTDSPFKDINDFKSRINAAVAALGTTDTNKDDIEAFRRLGLRESDWFNNGSGDPFIKGDYTGTYGDYFGNYLPQQLKLELLLVLLTAYNNKRFFVRGSSALQGRTALLLKEKYKTNEGLMNALRDYSLRPIKSLTPDELSELHGAYKYLATQPIDNKLLKELLSIDRYKGSAPNRFRKIDGIDNLIWDNTIGRVILILTRDLYNASKNQPLDLFKGVKTLEELNKEKDKAQLQYLNNTEWTADLKRELMGIAADVASVLDPEPFTAGGLALTGTGLRTYNRATDSDGFTWSDAGHTALDTGLSLLGMIPVVGDAALAARVVGKLLKAAGWLGAAFAAASVSQAAKAAWNKVVNGQDMTVDDWRAIGNVLMGATQARRIQLNRAAGNAVKNQGGTTTKEKVGEVEVKVNGKTEKVEIDEASAKELQQAYKAAGSDLKATTEALRKSRKVREQLEAKKTSDGKPAYTKEQLDAMEAPQAASGSVRGRIPGAHDTRGIKITERSVQTSGTPVSELNLGPLAQMRINAVLNNTGWFNRGDFGWNMRGRNSEQQSSGWLSRMWLNLKNPYRQLINNTTQTTPTVQSTPSTTNSTNKERLAELKQKFERKPAEQSNPREEYNLKQLHRSDVEIELFIKSYGEKGKSSSNSFSHGYGSNKNRVKNGEITIELGDGVKFSYKVNNAAEYHGNPGKVSTLRGNVARKIQEQLSSTKNVDKVKIGKLLQELKRKGWLKQGGKITDNDINNFLKNI